MTYTDQELRALDAQIKQAVAQSKMENVFYGKNAIDSGLPFDKAVEMYFLGQGWKPSYCDGWMEGAIYKNKQIALELAKANKGEL